MNTKIIIFLLAIGVFLALLLSYLPLTTASSNIINIKADCDQTIFIDNNNSKLAKKPVKYADSPLLHKTKGFETKKHVIKTKSGNKKYTFKTEYFLPMSGKKIGKKGEYNEYWYNCQAVAISGKYMYILTSSGYNLNKGFIVRYDMNMLNKFGVNGKNLVELRKIGASLRDNKNLTVTQKKIKKAIKIGPVFNTGHGQSLSFNPKTKSLWMWQDDKYLSTKLKLMKIDMKKLKPSSIYKFTINYKNKKINKVRNLAFDKDGNFYFNQLESRSEGDRIFKGKILNNKLKIQLLAIVKYRPGWHAQTLAINPVSNRLYMVFDGVFYTIPVAKLCKYTLTKYDFQYTILNTKREFEGISFDKYGNSYLLLIRGSEILKSV